MERTEVWKAREAQVAPLQAGWAFAQACGSERGVFPAQWGPSASPPTQPPPPPPPQARETVGPGWGQARGVSRYLTLGVEDERNT